VGTKRSHPPPDLRPAELAEAWLFHLQQLRRRAGDHHGKLVARAGDQRVAWDLREAGKVRLHVGRSATAILVGSDNGARPLAVHPLFRDENEGPRGLPATHDLGGGRSLIFRHTERSDQVEIEYHVGLAASAATLLFKRRAATFPAARLAFRPDYCLADLRGEELLRPATWQTLLLAFALVPILAGGVVSLGLWAAGVSPSAVRFGALAAVLVAMTGTFVCSASVSVVAAAVGGLPVSVVLGATYGILLQSAGGTDQVAAILGRGPLVVPGLGGLSALVTPPGATVALTAGTLAFLSVAMARLRTLGGQGTGRRRALKGVVGAALVAALGPGLIFGATALASKSAPEAPAFGAALAVIGGSACAVAVRVRSGSGRRALGFGAAYALLACLLVALGLRLQPAWTLLLASTANHILLQGSFFSLAYVLGEKVAGPQGGLIASLIEGGPPYCAFIVARHWL
jgi:hypothetical protein